MPDTTNGHEHRHSLRTLPGETRRELGRIARLPLDFVDKVDRLLRLIQDLDVLIDDIVADVLGPRACRSTGGCSGDTGKPGTGVTEDEHEPEWITNLWAEQRSDGKYVVIVGDGHLLLQPYLAALLLALAEDNGTSNDQGVGYKSLPDLAARVAKRTGGPPPSEPTLNKYIYRLRRQLVRHAGLTSDAIQTHARLGRRLAIRRTPAAR